MYWTVIQLEYTVLRVCLMSYSICIDARRGTSARQRRISARQYRVSAASMRGSAAATQPPGKVPRQSAAPTVASFTPILWHTHKFSRVLRTHRLNTGQKLTPSRVNVHTLSAISKLNMDLSKSNGYVSNFPTVPAGFHLIRPAPGLRAVQFR
ncbi:hypothetical protein DFH09DRAFT_1086519 [Mycena vulgaris]|nr:hypothetical protein DFH09DRAFT_1086519 [Mycena vulgaris]